MIEGGGSRRKSWRKIHQTLFRIHLIKYVFINSLSLKVAGNYTGLATGYELGGLRLEWRKGQEIFSFPKIVLTKFGAHADSCSMDAGSISRR
jgi:hypothetical protein